MGEIDKRNQKVHEILESLYSQAQSEEVVIDETSYKDSIEKLFSTKDWGLREIVLVAVIGMKLDSNYRASTKLYECKPRAIYEGPIKEFLIKKQIPHRKSGPLNIAKATVGLDTTWATQRKSPDVANAVVSLVQFMETSDEIDRVTNIGISLLRKLIAESKRREALSVNIEPSSDPEILYSFCYELITKTPDAGNTPQKISAFLLKNYHLSMNTGIIVTGEDDRASVTSTTSKKPGDINEESLNGIIYKVYEITVKKFDIDRIRDSYDCVIKYNTTHNCELNEIIVICRKIDCPDDMIKSNVQSYLGSYVYENIVYYYWDINEWICATLQRMPQDGRCKFYNDLNNYINGINTAEQVKQLWYELHNKME